MDDSKPSPQDLLTIARSAKENAHNPYSEYAVGAAVVTDSDTIFQGCNIETATFDMCSHAERTAIQTALANGHTDFTYMVISTDDQSGEPPCGTCRQFLAEFCEDSFVIHSDAEQSETNQTLAKYTLGELLPYAFRPEL